MSKPMDLRGHKYNMLTPIEPTGEKKWGKIIWKCSCDCGNYAEYITAQIRSGSVVSCGCSRSKTWQKKAEVLIGKAFGRLKVIKPVKERSNGAIQYLCKCKCGNETTVRGDQLKDGTTKSCGCLYDDMVHKLAGQKFGRLTAIKKADFKRKTDKSIHWECVCDCGTHKVLSSSDLVNGTIKSCGCLQDEWRKYYSGERHHFYNPKLTDEERLERYRYVLRGKNSVQWRKKIFERDNYTCGVCEHRGDSLVAHHLDGWNWAKDRRFDLDNGITLCKECHYDFHNIYGRGDNTKEQFEEHVETLAKGRLEWT